jgi:hypothetical protein
VHPIGFDVAFVEEAFHIHSLLFPAVAVPRHVAKLEAVTITAVAVALAEVPGAGGGTAAPFETGLAAVEGGTDCHYANPVTE